MNKTKIDWADSTWNPVTGCLHGCHYCYAASIAHRFAGFECRCGGEVIDDEKKIHGKNSIWNTTHNEQLHIFDKLPMRRTKAGEWKPATYPYGFDPTLHLYRLGEYENKKGRTIFVCSMADLFGEWVPDEWIQKVFKACEAAPQHRYLFLTKNPQRYNDLIGKRLLPTGDNFWYGGTRTGNDSDREHEAAMSGHTFLSIEPMLAPMGKQTLDTLECWDWVIIGAQTGSGADKNQLKREWIEEIVVYCQCKDIPVFMKNSLTKVWGESLIQNFPWEVTN